MGSITVNCQTIPFYLAVLLLFVTLEISCAISPDGEALVNLKTSIVSSDGIFLHWRQEDADPCKWKGVTCDKHTKRVIYLALGNHKLVGSITPAIGKLDQLKLLALHGNGLYGSIPPELGNCTKLQKLYLQGNYMSGIIPSEIGNLLELEILDLSSNTLSGFIPSSLSKLTKLTSFNASMNFLTGTIPSEGVLIKFTQNSFVGNRGLCGMQVNVKCNNTASTSKPGIFSGPPNKKAASKVVVSTLATIFSLLLVALMCFWGCYLYKKFGKYDRTGLAVDVSGGTYVIDVHKSHAKCRPKFIEDLSSL